MIIYSHKLSAWTDVGSTVIRGTRGFRLIVVFRISWCDMEFDVHLSMLLDASG
jgi:hypothetical protein